ncbi:MAG: alpha-L-fucosidase [Prevotellaceae bacterium]|nr:alpha-L-fucosidase [Prevotellaceae bacterium]MDO4931540.1 alpha-L-fucosidase [Prevotellaceae bacterium]
MKKSIITAMLCLFASGTVVAQDYDVPVSERDEPMAQGKFKPTWQSLGQYDVPEWFRNAKFGIWAHWGPQCVEGSGDWMAREMYMEGSGAYNYHVKNYGHPSEFGFKDVLPLFKAERWNPDSLVAYYKSLGAEYFFALGNHHDNFDLWDSKYQPWNSQNIGPHRDILAGWAAAARKQGLPFGVSLHADHAWTWYEPAQRYDRNGGKAGVPYDGKLTKADGKGKWWDGMDPQQLYAQNHEMSKGSWADGMIHSQWAWGNGAAVPSEEFVTNFYNRTLDVINRYNPELLYFDVTALPFYPVSDCGLKIAAHFYNHNMAANKGRLTAVMFGKILTPEQRKALVWDVERGAPNEIMKEPWQSCSCIGGWHYNTGIYERNHYKKAGTIARLLVDIVSKNGNLLLSVPLRADGTFDEKEKAILDEFGAWMRINRQAIVGTRPWKVFGEGPMAEKRINLNAQGFNEGAYNNLSAEDIRFTQKGSVVYAMPMGWPADGKMLVRSMAGTKVRRVTLLGHGRLKFTMTAEGLSVTLPQKPLNDILPVLEVR